MTDEEKRHPAMILPNYEQIALLPINRKLKCSYELIRTEDGIKVWNMRMFATDNG